VGVSLKKTQAKYLTLFESHIKVVIHRNLIVLKPSILQVSAATSQRNPQTLSPCPRILTPMSGSLRRNREQASGLPSLSSL
jgi:hypothetical protein